VRKAVDGHDTFLGLCGIDEAMLLLGHAGTLVEESRGMAFELPFVPAASMLPIWYNARFTGP
jgi:hypothetical protein